MNMQIVDLEDIYTGNKVFCITCGQTSNKFNDYNNGRKNAICPICKSLERHRGQLVWMMTHTNFFTKSFKVLHIAPEERLGNIFASMPNLKYVSADLIPGLAMIQMDITSISYPDHTFDVLICNHVLEHIENDYDAINELHRILKPGGWAIISFPIYAEKTFEDPSVTTPVERKSLYYHHDHARLCGYDYYTRLEKAGFFTNFIDYSEYSEQEKQVLGLNNGPNSVFYVCRK